MTLAYFAFSAFLIAISSSAEERVTYQMPPRAIADIADAAPTPGVVLDPTKRWLLVLERASLSSIGELSLAEHRLAGLRIHPATNARSRRLVAETVALISVADGTKRAVTGLPENPRIDHAAFSPDGTRIAFTHTTSSGLELWTVDVASGRATRILQGVDQPSGQGTSDGLRQRNLPRTGRPRLLRPFRFRPSSFEDWPASYPSRRVRCTSSTPPCCRSCLRLSTRAGSHAGPARWSTALRG